MTAMDLTFDDGGEGAFDEALPAGTRLLNGQYTIEKYLSNGGFGITYFARDSLDRRVVVKECYPEAFCNRKNKTVLARSRAHQGEFRSFVDMFVREAHSIAKLKHPNIVGVHQVFEDNETAYMALDLIDGQDLLDVIELGSKQMSPDEISTLLLKVLDAIATIHKQDMLHRDISPDNILIDAWGNPVLIDFGAAREEASKKSRALSAVLVVKDGYSPQEFYIAGSQQAPCSDLYALAATFVHLITGEAPPNSQTRLAAIAANKPDPHVPLAERVEGYSLSFLQALDTAMQVFPQDRLQSAQDWILQIDDEKRREAALAKADVDQDIEDTIMQLVMSTQQETTPVEVQKIKAPAERHKTAGVPTPPKQIRKAHALQSETVTPDEAVKTRSLAPDVGPKEPHYTRPTRPKKQASDWIALCHKRQAKAKQPVQKTRRVVARLMISVALVLLILDGHAGTVAEAIMPVVQGVMSLQVRGAVG